MNEADRADGVDVDCGLEPFAPDERFLRMSYGAEDIGEIHGLFERRDDGAGFFGELFGVGGRTAPDADFGKIMNALAPPMGEGLHAAAENGEDTGVSRK